MVFGVRCVIELVTHRKIFLLLQVKDKLCGFAEVIDVVKHLGKHIKAHHRSRITEMGPVKNQSGIKEKSTSSQVYCRDLPAQE